MFSLSVAVLAGGLQQIFSARALYHCDNAVIVAVWQCAVGKPQSTRLDVPPKKPAEQTLRHHLRLSAGRETRVRLDAAQGSIDGIGDAELTLVFSTGFVQILGQAFAEEPGPALNAGLAGEFRDVIGRILRHGMCELKLRTAVRRGNFE